MSAVDESTDLDAHQAKIADALTELRGARVTCKHNPTASNRKARDICQQRLNDLLDAYPIEQGKEHHG